MRFVLLSLALLACKPTPAPAQNGPVPEVQPGAPALRRLTQDQYERVVVDLFGEGLALPSSLEPDTEEGGLLSVGASTTSLSALGVERYETAATLLAEQVVSDPDRLALILPCTPTSPGDADCAGDFVAKFGRLAWRRSLSAEEQARLVQLITEIGAAEDDFNEGVYYAITALLQSPNFVYRREHGVPTEDPSVRLLTGTELATRLSFTLWGSTPDEELLSAAEAGELDSDEGLATQAQRLLDDPRARIGLRALFTEAFGLYALDELSKDPTVFTHANAALGADAREETLALIEDLVFEQDADFLSLLTTRRTFINPRLAALYEVPAPDPTGFAAATFPADSRRRGLLGQASFLALMAHPTRSSATLRGQFIRETLLCQPIPPPPADVDTSIPEADASSPTLRDRIASHLEVESCAVCHERTDPLGLGLENFDGIGRWRDTENGAPIDSSGDLDGVAFAGPRDLGAVLREHPSLGPCMTTHLYEYAVGHSLVEGEEALRDWLAAEFWLSGGSFRALLYATVMSPGFRRAGEPD